MSMKPLDIYQDLYKKYGPQHWWPVGVFDSPRHSEQSEESRDPSATPRDDATASFEICVGAILTQNTAWTNVIKALELLAKNNLVTPSALVVAADNLLESAVKPSGYFRQKAKKLKIFSNFLLQKYDGDLSKMKMRETASLRTELLDIWGIGEETADSILLYALEKPVFVIDAYTRRLLDTYGITYKTYQGYQAWFQFHLPSEVELFKEFHALIVADAKVKRITNNRE